MNMYSIGREKARMLQESGMIRRNRRGFGSVAASRLSRPPGCAVCSPCRLPPVASIAVRLLLLAIACLPASAPAQEAAVPPVAALPGDGALLPAAMGVRTDEAGNAWNVESSAAIGRVGSSMVNSGLVLSVNGEKFTGGQPMMTRDGREFVVPGGPLASLPGLRVVRRARFLRDTGGIRYLEIFLNESANALTFNLSLANSFSGNYQTFLTDRGASEPTLLGESESGLVVLPGASQANRAFLFTLAAAGAPNHPSVSAQNRYGLAFHYQLELQPGESAVIAHAVAQVVIPTDFAPARLRQVFRPYALEEMLSDLPEEFRSRVANGPAADTGPGEGLAPGGIGSLGVERAALDVLAIGEDSRMLGEAHCESLRLTGPHGSVEIPFEEVAALAGGGWSGGAGEGNARVFFRDGQVLSGRAEAAGLSFSLTNGGKMDLDPAELDRLVRAPSEGEGDLPDGALALVETRDGQRLAATGESFALAATTAWGRLRFTSETLHRLGPSAADPAGWWVRLRDGTGCLAYFPDERLLFDSPLFGPVEMDFARVRSVLSPGAWASESGSPEGIADAGAADRALRPPPHLARIETEGRQMLVGEWLDEGVSLVSEGRGYSFSPREIRQLVRRENGSAPQDGLPRELPSFEAELHGGGDAPSVAAGTWDQDFVALKVGAETWRIPLQDILRLSPPPPGLGEEAGKRVKQLVKQLGADAWSAREDATRELAAIGSLVRPFLEAEAGKNGDPEVIRRIERVLAGMEER